MQNKIKNKNKKPVKRKEKEEKPEIKKPEEKPKEVKTKTIEHEVLDKNIQSDDFRESFEPTSEAAPSIKKREEKIRDMERFLETVPAKKEESKENRIYGPVEEQLYLKDVYSQDNNYETRREAIDEQPLRRIQRDIRTARKPRETIHRVDLKEENAEPTGEMIKYELQSRTEGRERASFFEDLKKYESKRKNRRI